MLSGVYKQGRPMVFDAFPIQKCLKRFLQYSIYCFRIRSCPLRLCDGNILLYGGVSFFHYSWCAQPRQSDFFLTWGLGGSPDSQADTAVAAAAVSQTRGGDVACRIDLDRPGCLRPHLDDRPWCVGGGASSNRGGGGAGCSSAFQPPMASPKPLGCVKGPVTVQSETLAAPYSCVHFQQHVLRQYSGHNHKQDSSCLPTS